MFVDWPWGVFTGGPLAKNSAKLSTSQTLAGCICRLMNINGLG